MQTSINFAVNATSDKVHIRSPYVHHGIRSMCAGVGKTIEPGRFFHSRNGARRNSMSYWYQTLFWEETFLRTAAWTMKDCIRRMLGWTDGKPCSSSFTYFSSPQCSCPSPVKFICWRFQSGDLSKTPGAVPVVPAGVRLNTAQQSLAQEPSPCSVQAEGPARGSRCARRCQRREPGRPRRAAGAGPGCWCHLLATPLPEAQSAGTWANTLPCPCCGKLAGRKAMRELIVPEYVCTESP